MAAHPDPIDPDELYQRLVGLKVEIDSHESDLYVPVTTETTALVKLYRFRAAVTTFRNEKDCVFRYSIPFAYKPFWDARAAR